MIGHIDQHSSETEFLAYLEEAFGPAKRRRFISDEEYHMLIENQAVQGPRSPASRQRVLSIEKLLASPHSLIERLRVAVQLAQDAGETIPKGLRDEVTGPPRPVSETPELHKLMSRKSEHDRRPSHPLLQYDRYGVRDFALAIRCERYDIAAAIFSEANIKMRTRLIAKVHALARQK